MVDQRHSKATQALTFVGLLCILSVVTVLAVLLAYTDHDVRTQAQRMLCSVHLDGINASAHQFANDHAGRYPGNPATNLGPDSISAQTIVAYFRALSNELKTTEFLVCPADRRHRYARVSFTQLSNSNISYFVNITAGESTPQVLLSGDRNLEFNGSPVKPGTLTITSNSLVSFTREMHRHAGNVSLPDGSVQHITSAGLQQHVRSLGAYTNRFLIP